MKLTTVLLTLSVLVMACDKPATPEAKTDDPTAKNTTTGATTAAATGTAVTAPSPVIADTDLATPADFEESAEKAISKANYKAELTALEADITKE